VISLVEQPAMSFRLSFHQPPLGPTAAHLLDDPPDLSCKHSTRAVDDPLLSCNPLPACSDRWQSVWQSTRRHQMDYLVLAGLDP
jgi:hypothetical protein